MSGEGEKDWSFIGNRPHPICDYWGNGNLEDMKKRFLAMQEVYPIKNPRDQLQQLRSVIKDSIENNMGDGAIEEMNKIIDEIDKRLSKKEEITEIDVNFFASDIFHKVKAHGYINKKKD